MDVQIREKFSFCVAVPLTGLHSSLDLQVRGEPDVAFGDKHADTVQDEELHDAQGHQWHQNTREQSIYNAIGELTSSTKGLHEMTAE